MPELPEVETVKRGLRPTIEGRKFTYVETRRGDLRIPFPEDFENRLTGRRVERLWRRAKYIMADKAASKAYKELHHFRVFLDEHGCHELFAESFSHDS